MDISVYRVASLKSHDKRDVIWKIYLSLSFLVYTIERQCGKPRKIKTKKEIKLERKIEREREKRGK